MISLLNGLFKDPKLHEALTNNAESIFRTVIIPTAVWRSGRIAATLRKGAMSVLLTALEVECIPREVLVRGGEDWRGVWASCLDDEEQETRFLTARVMGRVFRLVQGSLDSRGLRGGG